MGSSCRFVWVLGFGTISFGRQLLYEYCILRMNEFRFVKKKYHAQKNWFLT